MRRNLRKSKLRTLAALHVMSKLANCRPFGIECNIFYRYTMARNNIIQDVLQVTVH